MPVRSVKNQYRGLNAHLHSHWQTHGGWSEFHTGHIVHLAAHLKAQLRPLHYTARIEPSLQLRRLDERPTDPEADVTIVDPARRSFLPVRPAALEAASALVLPAPDVLEGSPISEALYRAVAIYAPDADAPVAWIELLSPTNKGADRDGQRYLSKRLDLVQNGIVLVELDYLHESGNTFYHLPVYRVRKGKSADPAAHPYRIAVIDPRPEYATSQARFYEFDVDSPIPAAVIPLNAGDRPQVDFDLVYQKTITELFFGDLVDYARLPEAFDRYSEADQARIVARMLAVLDAAQQGADLDASAPLPVETLDLPAGLARLAHMSQTLT